jgi:hypothetical protein
MDALWVLLITGTVMVVYLVAVVRAAIRGKQWAIDTLKATSCLVEGPSGGRVWLRERQAEGPEGEPELETEPEVDCETSLVA